MRGRNISSSSASALLATSCLLVASGTVAYHAVKYNEKCKLAQKQQDRLEQQEHKQQQQNVAARTIQAAWRRESYRRTSQASTHQDAPPPKKPTSTTAILRSSIQAIFHPSRNVCKLLGEQQQLQDKEEGERPSIKATAVAKSVVHDDDTARQIPADFTLGRGLAVASPGSDNHTLVQDDDDESSMNSQDHLCLSSPTTTSTSTSTTTSTNNNNKWILLDDRHEYHRFLSMQKIVILLLVALAAVAMEFALTLSNESTGLAVNKLVSLDSPDSRWNGFPLAPLAHHYHKTTLLETTTTTLREKHHKIEWQSLPLHFGAK